jgi:hypothetical protein
VQKRNAFAEKVGIHRLDFIDSPNRSNVIVNGVTTNSLLVRGDRIDEV